MPRAQEQEGGPALLSAEIALVQLRQGGKISNETMNRVIREPDLEES